MKDFLKMTAMAATAVVAFAGAASAVSVTALPGDFTGNLNFGAATPSGTGVEIGGFLFDPANLTSGSGDGNCNLSGGGSCIQLNNNATTTMTTAPPGGMFDLLKLSFVLDGQQSVLGVFNVSVSDTVAFVRAEVEPNSPQQSCSTGALCVDQNTWLLLDFEGSANGVTEIRFENLGTANVRIGAIQANLVPDVAPVPLPAAGWMLLAGIGGIAAMARRRKAAA